MTDMMGAMNHQGMNQKGMDHSAMSKDNMDMGGMDHSNMHGGMAMDHSQHSGQSMPGMNQATRSPLAKPSSTVRHARTEYRPICRSARQYHPVLLWMILA